MSKVEEIEKAVEKLPLQDFIKLAGWVDRRRKSLSDSESSAQTAEAPVRNHSSFLNSYAPSEEGLYDDVAGG